MANKRNTFNFSEAITSSDHKIYRDDLLKLTVHKVRLKTILKHIFETNLLKTKTFP